MFRTAIIAAGLAALTGAPALAQSPAVAPFAVTGDAPQVCALQAPVLGVGRAVNFTGLDGSSLAIDTLADPATLATLAARISVDFGAVCNYPHRLLVQSQNNGLWRSVFSGLTPQGFADAVPYTATLRWGTLNAVLQADASTHAQRELTLAIDRPTAGILAVRLDIEPGASNLRQGAPLLAGVYQDTLRITVQPQ